MKDRILEEIDNITLYIEDCDDHLECLKSVDDYDEREFTIDQARRYRYYKKVLEEAVKGFPNEIGSY